MDQQRRADNRCPHPPRLRPVMLDKLGCVLNLQSRRAFVGGLTASCIAAAVPSNDWVELFDGKTPNGWRASEHQSSWTVRNGALTADGPRSHLFYVGPQHRADFRNFELETEVLARNGCNSGVYFHTRYQESGFPEKGFEVQVNNTALGDNGYRERKKTGSLYGLRNIYKQLIPDNQWFKIAISVRGKNVQVRLNGMLVVDYVEPIPPIIPEGGERERFLDHGTFALQCHNEGSVAFYRRVRVRPLPDDLPTPAGEVSPVVDKTYRDIINVGRHNVPMVDFDVHLGGSLNVEQALRKSRRDGISYGLLLKLDSNADAASAEKWLASMSNQPVFFGLQPTVRKWTRLLTRSTVASFDYVLADSTSWTEAQGRRDNVANPQEFMEGLTESIVKLFDHEPIDIYGTPTYLPAQIAADYDNLWTEERTTKVVSAAARNQVAIELNNQFRLPSATFVRAAKRAGCKFSFGSNNQAGVSPGRCEYGLQILSDCKLEWQDFWTPGPATPRAVDRRADLFRS